MRILPDISAGAADAVIRDPVPAELERVLYLFSKGPLNPAARLVGAVRTRPMERFIAAAAWWPEGNVGRFQLVCQPGVARGGVAGLLLERVAGYARNVGMASLQWSGLLAENDDWCRVLRDLGFEPIHTELVFEVAYREAWTRVMRLHERYQSQVPASWRTEAIRNHSPETALAVIGPHRLMTPEEVRHCWRPDIPSGFELDLSSLLFDGDRPFGALLVRAAAEGFYLDVEVVQEPNPRLRSLGGMLMMYHGLKRVGPEGPARWLRFRSGQTEHRQTGNLARRLGGRELGRCHQLARML